MVFTKLIVTEIPGVHPFLLEPIDNPFERDRPFVRRGPSGRLGGEQEGGKDRRALLGEGLG